MWTIQVLSVLCLTTVEVYSIALNETCTDTAACLVDITNSYCQQLYTSGDSCLTVKACTCLRGYVVSGGNCVAAQYVGATCTATTDDHCAETVTNSVCTSTKCTCPAPHTSLSKYICVASTVKKIGEPCTATDTCYYEHEATKKDGICTSDVCVCPNNTKAFGLTCIPIKIDDPCTTGKAECPLKSSCTTDTCSCDASYTASADKTACNYDTTPLAANDTCVAGVRDCPHPLTCVACPATPGTLTCSQKKGLLGDDCKIDSDCSMKVSTCTGKKCACNAGYTAYGTSACLPSGATGSVCWSNAECTVPATNACLNNLCTACPAHHVGAATGTVCVPALNRVCSMTTDCTGTANLFCFQEYQSGDTCVTGKTCKCKKGFVENSDACVAAQYVGDTCTASTNDHCAATVPNSVCTSTKCTCPDTHTSISKYMCVASTYKKIGDACAIGDTCYYELDARLETDAACTGDVCVCPTHTKVSGISCRPIKLGDPCTTGSTECPLKASCTSSTCSCDATHTVNAAKTACDVSASPLGANDVCVTGEGKCASPLTCIACATPATATTKCGRRPVLLGEMCAEDSDCSIHVAVCSNSVCACPPTLYKAYGTTMCLTPDCTVNPATMCPTAENKECDTATRRCRCKAPAAELGATPLTCTAGNMNTNCMNNTHCPNLENSACSGGKCGCASGFKATSNKCEKSEKSEKSEKGAGIKASWMPIVILSGLIPALYMMLF